ncbi:MAG: N-acetylmuramic acid 6-phosphate etherase, partial [Chitinophagales bacterium]
MELFKKTTEAVSKYNHLEQMTVRELLTGINREDKSVSDSVERVIPQLELLINVIVAKMKDEGR